MIDGLSPMHDMIIVELETNLKAHIALCAQLETQLSDCEQSVAFWHKIADDRAMEIIRLKGLLPLDA